MNLNQLRYVKRIAMTNSFSAAARICHVTQPTLSNAVAQLEQELGASLFQRSTRSVSLSSFGEILLPYIEAILCSQDDLIKTAQGLLNPEKKLCRLGMSPVIDSQLLSIIVDAFSQTDPELEFVYKECLLGDLDHRIELGQIDFAFRISQALTSCEEALPFYQEPLCFIPAHKSFSGNSIELKNICDEIFILGPEGCGLAGATKKLFNQHDLELKLYRGQAINYSIMEEWAGLGIGSTILPASKVSDNNVSAMNITVNKRPVTLQYEIAWNKTVLSFPYLNRFKQHLLDNVNTILRGRLRPNTIVA